MRPAHRPLFSAGRAPAAPNLSVNAAGPAIIVSSIIVAGISQPLGRALSDMAVAQPTAGSFGVWGLLNVLAATVDVAGDQGTRF